MGVVVNNLTKLYGSQKAVDSISFEINKGEIVGFIGPNGSGKSTTMKSICGILSPDNGNIRIDGTLIGEENTHIKKQIGYLPENNPLYYDEYIIEYLRYIGKLYKVRNLTNRVNEIIEVTGLTPERNKKIGQLSKGYKQRVGLAQAMIHDPEILILDEPTTGLDPNQLIEIRELIKHVGKNKTVLLSTHILQEVEAICHRVIMINKGRLVADQTTDSVRKGKSKTQTIRVEFKNPPALSSLKSIEGIEAIRPEGDTVFYLESELDNDLREKVFQFASKNGISILEMQTLKRSLEDTFKELSGN
jgi:ABC-2 type transport system ATP-binding protein